jgi:hypothetical protein
MATFFNVHKVWRRTAGGQLVLNGVSQKMDVVIESTPNSLCGIVFSYSSLHQVNAICEDITRTTLYQEWDFVND